MNPEIFFREWFGRKWRVVAFEAMHGQVSLCECDAEEVDVGTSITDVDMRPKVINGIAGPVLWRGVRLVTVNAGACPKCGRILIVDGVGVCSHCGAEKSK